MIDPSSSDSRLEAIFDQALRQTVGNKPLPAVEARFYPYAGLSSTIRLRRGRVYARVSDLLRHSPGEVLAALACILIAKLYRLKTPLERQRVYREYVSRPEVVEATEASRRHRGYKMITSPRGRIYDLDSMFDALNEKYFEGRLPKPALSWNRQKTSRIFGHHDPVHQAIIISRTLDSPRVPPCAIEFVLYHEMLHIKHPPISNGSRRVYHSREFRDDERRFAGFDQAVSLLEHIASSVGRKQRKKPHGN